MADDLLPTHPESTEPPRPRQIVLGLIAAPALSDDIVERLARSLPVSLQQRFPDIDWRVVVRIDPFAGFAVERGLFDLARRRMLEEGWQLTICLIDRPFKAGRQPVTAQASASLGVGIVSVPALGARDLQRRLLAATLRTIDALLRGRRTRLEDLGKLSSPLGLAIEPEPGTIAFATDTARGNLRLLLGTIRGNRPWAVILGLSHSLVAALGTSAFGLTSPVIWRMANAMPWPQSLFLSFLALAVIGFTMIASHALWEWAPNRAARTRVVLVNMATVATIAIGIVTSYVALLSLNLFFGRMLIARTVLEVELRPQLDGIRHVAFAQYVRIAWLVSSLATLGGALGAVLENSELVRAAAFCIRSTERRGNEAAPLTSTSSQHRTSA